MDTAIKNVDVHKESIKSNLVASSIEELKLTELLLEIQEVYKCKLNVRFSVDGKLGYIWYAN